jgi:ribonuclease P protein component
VARDSSAAPAAAAKRGRLTRAAEFDAVASLGKAVAGRYLTLRFREAGGGEARVGFAVPRKVGGAVERNAVKRRLREAVEQRRERLQPGTDYVFIARSGIAPLLEAKGMTWLGGQIDELMAQAHPEAVRQR